MIRASRVVWLFSLVLGHSGFLFARYVLHQDLQTLLRSRGGDDGIAEQVSPFGEATV